MSSHYHQSGAGTQNQGNTLGNRSCIRQSRLFREYESGNKVKDILGLSNLTWKTDVNEGVFRNKPTYDMNGTHNKAIGQELKQGGFAGLYSLTNKHGNQSICSSLPFSSSLAFKFRPDESVPSKPGQPVGMAHPVGGASTSNYAGSSSLRSGSSPVKTAGRNISFQEPVSDKGRGSSMAAQSLNKPFSPSGTGASGGGFAHEYFPSSVESEAQQSAVVHKSPWQLGSNDAHRRFHDPEVHNNYCPKNFDNFVDYSPGPKIAKSRAPVATPAYLNQSHRHNTRYNSRHDAGYNIITGR
jgi:hypothetical protein